MLYFPFDVIVACREVASGETSGTLSFETEIYGNKVKYMGSGSDCDY